MQRLGLNVQVYDPMVHYQQVRDAWVGLRNPDGRLICIHSGSAGRERLMRAEDDNIHVRLAKVLHSIYVRQ